MKQTHWLFGREALTFAVIYLIISFGWELISGRAFNLSFIVGNLLGGAIAWVVYAFVLHKVKQGAAKKK